MLRVADALSVTKMALYRYGPGKAELVALMIDIGIGEAHGSQDKALDFGLARILDGVGLLVARRPRQ